jgi:hypothetical protein
VKLDVLHALNAGALQARGRDVTDVASGEQRLVKAGGWPRIL